MDKSKAKGDETRALFKTVRDQYGNRLSPKELKEVRREVKIIVDTAEALMSVKLKNSDEPFLVFTPYRKEK